jgi:hypothetical protein
MITGIPPIIEFLFIGGGLTFVSMYLGWLGRAFRLIEVKPGDILINGDYKITARFALYHYLVGYGLSALLVHTFG